MTGLVDRADAVRAEIAGATAPKRRRVVPGQGAAMTVDVLARLRAYRAALASQAARGLISDDELRRVDGLIDWFTAGLHEGAAG